MTTPSGAMADYHLMVAAEEALTAVVLRGPMDVAGRMQEPRDVLHAAIAKLVRAHPDLAQVQVTPWETVRDAVRKA